MKYRYLGNSGLKVSELCLGTMTFGGVDWWEKFGSVGKEGASRFINTARDAGINFFDTANVYSFGASEEILGHALKNRRDDAIIATKVRGRMGDGPNQVGLTRNHIIDQCNASLKRLGIDYIDLCQVHAFDNFTPLEETLRALDDLVRWGKARYIGCSNFAGWQLMKALAISSRDNLEKFITLQAYYNILERDLELDLIPLCRDQGLGILVWSPLGGGFLSGKYRKGGPEPSVTRLSAPNEPFLKYNREKGYRIVDLLEGIARTHNATVAQVALNYILRKPAITAVIIGARNMNQLNDNLGSVSFELSDEEVKSIDEASPLSHVYPYWMQEMWHANR